VKEPKISEKDSGTDYQGFLSSIRLIGMGLSSCKAELDREAYAHLENDNTSRKISADYDVTETADTYFEVASKYTLAVSSPQSPKCLTLECTFEAHFHCKPEFPAEFPKRFAGSELKILMWPYFRQFAQDITARMYITPIVVPLQNDNP
jgi:hypothetical protein